MKKNRMVMADFDRRIPMGKIQTLWAWLSSQLWPGTLWNTGFAPSPSKRGWHFWAEAINRQQLSSLKVLLAQCLIGSDIGRERANFRRIQAGEKDWNWLFDTKRVSLYKKSRRQNEKNNPRGI